MQLLPPISLPKDATGLTALSPLRAALGMVSPIATSEHLHIAQPELAPEFARQIFKISSLHLTLMQRARKDGMGDLILSAPVL